MKAQVYWASANIFWSPEGYVLTVELLGSHDRRFGIVVQQSVQMAMEALLGDDATATVEVIPEDERPRPRTLVKVVAPQLFVTEPSVLRVAFTAAVEQAVEQDDRVRQFEKERVKTWLATLHGAAPETPET